MNLKQYLLRKLPMQLLIIKNQGLRFLFGWIESSFRYFSFMLTVIVAIITIFSFFNKDVHYDQIVLLGISFDFKHILYTVILCASIYAFIKKLPAIKSRTKVGDIDVVLECCDLLSQKGLKVIHTTDTFDVNLIKKESLMGQFVGLCSEVNFDLSNAIKHNLNTTDFLMRDESLPGEKDRYKLGTVCPIYIEKMSNYYRIDHFGTYCLVAFTRMAPDTVELKESEYRGFFINMWKNLSKPGIVDNDIVNVTIMGNKLIHFSDKYTITQRIGIIVETFFEACREKTCCHTLRICIREKDISNIDFSEFDTILKYVSGRAQITQTEIK